MTDSLRKTIEQDGYAIVPHLIHPSMISSLEEAIGAVSASDGVHRRQSVYAIRNLLDIVPEVYELAKEPAILMPVAAVIGGHPFVVRALLFDKTPDANWKVTWHQDVSIAVKEKIVTAGFGPWSLKDGVWHVRPPATILERMLTVRLHLDPCDERNGPLHVIPGSHRHGALDADDIAIERLRTPAVVCSVPAGGALLMRPLLLHASSACEQPGHRRVIHLEYAAEELPLPLEWQRAALPASQGVSCRERRWS